jgi:hypothetical protein
MEILKTTCNASQVSILRTLLYYGIFRCPLSLSEIRENAGLCISEEELKDELSHLTETGIIFFRNGYYSTQAVDENLERRLRGNRMAETVMPMARKYCLKIASYPFVKAVMLSGGISKNFFDDKSDLDYFIVTRSNRLWICRTLLILRYKSLPRSKKKFWCTNYFVSPEGLCIPEQNQFTATELTSLVPVVNYEMYKDPLLANPWSREILPNKIARPDLLCYPVPRSRLRNAVEWALSGVAGDLLDEWLRRITLRHWQKKYPEMNKKDFELQFRSRREACKRHEQGYQQKVLNRWEEEMRKFESALGISLR